MNEVDPGTWQPFCGAQYPQERVAGDPVVCTIEPHDPSTSKHQNEELGFSWWG